MRLVPFVLSSSLGALAATLAACSPLSGPSVPLFSLATVDDAVGTTAQTSLAVDVTGQAHVAYSQGPGGSLRYATCGSDCSQSSGWTHVTVDGTANSGFFNSIVAGAGGLHVIYQVYDGQGDLRYGTCAATCLQTTSWQTTTVDSAGNTGRAGSLAVGPAGQLHVAYLDSVPVAGDVWRVKYASCTAACTTPASWVITVLDSAVSVDASSRGLALDANGRLHLVYQKADTLTGLRPIVYSTCAANCTSAASWQTAEIDDDALDPAAPVLAVDAQGVPSVAYWDEVATLSAISYAHCGGVCTTSAGWSILPIQAVPAAVSDLDQHSLVVDASGHPQMTFQHGGLAYAACNVNCTSPGAWFEVLIDPGSVGEASSLGLLSGGRVGIVYLSPPNGDLKFALSN